MDGHEPKSYFTHIIHIGLWEKEWIRLPTATAVLIATEHVDEGPHRLYSRELAPIWSRGVRDLVGWGASGDGMSPTTFCWGCTKMDHNLADARIGAPEPRPGTSFSSAEPRKCEDRL